MHCDGDQSYFIMECLGIHECVFIGEHYIAKHGYT